MYFEWGGGIEVRREQSCTRLMWRGFDAGKQAEMVITDWWPSSGIERTEGVSGYGGLHALLESRCGMSRGAAAPSC
jgi:hypothetical protein